MLCSACKNLTVDGLYQRACEHPSGSKVGWNQAGYLTLHPSYESLERAARNGCENCQVFHEGFVRSSGNPERLRRKLDLLSTSQNHVLPVIIFLETAFLEQGKRPITKLLLQVGTEPWKSGVDDRLGAAFRINRPRYIQETNPYEFRYIEIDYNLGSDENFEIAQEWISDCCSNHTKTSCPPIEDVILPTRLIDVGRMDGTDDPKLIEPLNGQKGRYLALSHCWGKSTRKPRLTTTHSTLDLRLKAIPITLMPANFYDATIITRRLGYRYLWIDSLCIIQDSAPDWETESQNMGNIYKNAAVTIAAAAAMDSDGGMLRSDYDPSKLEDKFQPTQWFLIDRKKTNLYAASEERDARTEDMYGKNESTPDNLPCQIRLHRDKVGPSVSLTPLRSFSDMEENWFRCVTAGPLGHRGWTLQERILSRRMLYYGVRQIYWQCPSSRRAADGESVPPEAAKSFRTMGSNNTEGPDPSSSVEFQKRGNVSQQLDENIERAINKRWYSILQLYVTRSLTKDTDKLPALAGMAAFIHSITGDTYIAGFWGKHVLVSLLWTAIPIWAGRASSEYEIEKPQWELAEPTIQGPSWSWAGVDVKDRLDFWADHDPRYRQKIWEGQDAGILDIDVPLIGKNPFGRIKGGKLAVKGYTYPRWDLRSVGWDPYNVQAWINAKTRPHGHTSGSKICKDGVILWDYLPRHRMKPIIKLLLHLWQAFIYTCTFLIWQGANVKGEGRRTDEVECPYCKQYLCLHILSIVAKETSIEYRRGDIDMWSLILEPVDGVSETYRRIGIANKEVHISEDEFVRWTDSGPPLGTPAAFSSWSLKTVNII